MKAFRTKLAMLLTLGSMALVIGQGYAADKVVISSQEVAISQLLQQKVLSAPGCKVGQTAEVSSHQEIARRGCCSWHGGVCGCSNGRAMCCDGMPSPSCGCD